jgi:hypothetical protein
VEADESIIKAINALAVARDAFQEAVRKGLILGNDNHIGDIGEYWVRRHFESKSNFNEYAPKKNSPYDIELIDGTKVSVKTITAWSERGYGTQVKPLCGNDWGLLAAVFLNEKLFAEKIALVPLDKLITHEQFVANEKRRSAEETAAYPRFQWWDWLDQYTVC